MSVKDDAMAALHVATQAIQSEAIALGTELAAAKAAVESKGAQLLQAQALVDALKLSHGVLSGSTAVAPVAASAIGTVKKWALPVGGSAAGLAAYAHWGLKLF